jgi:RNA polymerase sigma-70 factor (ECF subfamily)
MENDASVADATAERLRAGDQAALGDLFLHYRDSLRKMIELRLDHRLKGRVSASDVLQEAYLDALQRIPHFAQTPEMPAYVWLRLIAGQRLVDVHRRHMAQKRCANQEISLNRDGTLGASSTCLAAQLVGNVPSPSQAAARLELMHKVETALESLDPLDREVLSLRHFEELSNRDAAAILGIETAAASKRYLRALERLKGVLMDDPSQFDSFL